MRMKVLLEICPLFILLIAAPAWAIKPRPPLQLSFQQTPLSEREDRLTMVAKANVDIGNAVLSLEVPPGLHLTEGEEKGWEGSLKKGETRQLDWTVQSVDPSPRQVIGKAVIRLETGEAFTETSALTLHEANKDERKEAPTHAPSAKRKQGGETILEFKGK